MANGVRLGRHSKKLNMNGSKWRRGSVTQGRGSGRKGKNLRSKASLQSFDEFVFSTS
jgi:hypothetical protein